MMTQPHPRWREFKFTLYRIFRNPSAIIGFSLLFIFAAVRRGVTPQIHALSTLIMMVTVVLVVLTERFTRRQENE